MSPYRSALVSALVLAVVPAVAVAQLDTVFLRHYDGGQSDEDWVSDMAFDDMGNVYLCGTAVTGSAFTDIVVVKYTPDGDSLWSAVYQGSGGDEDSAAAIAVDMEGNAYVCGWSTESGSGMEMFTMKVTQDGTIEWTHTFGGVDGDDAALDLCLSEDGRVYVTGFVSDTSLFNLDYCTIAYEPGSGETLWVRYYNRTPENDEDVSVAICPGPGGFVYVTGYSYDEGTDYDFLTIKYSGEGNREWLKRYNNRPWIDDDYGAAIAYNGSADGVVVGGTVYNDNHDYDYYTIMYSAEGDSVWARDYNRYPSDDEDLLMALAVDESGNTYVTGTSSDDNTDYDITTLKYSSSGLQQWVSRYDLDSLEDGGVHVSVGMEGEVYVTGYAESWTTDWDLSILRLKGDDGSVQWAYNYDDPVAHNEDHGCRVMRREDWIYATGSSFGNATDMDFVFLKLREIRKDYAVLDIVAPESLHIDDSLVPLAIVQNQAAFADSCWLRMTILPMDYPESTWVSLAAGETDTVQFPVWHPFEQGTLGITCWSELLGDESPDNDTAYSSVVVWDDTTGLASLKELMPARFDMAVAPNPAKAYVSLAVWLPSSGAASVGLYDITGSQVRHLSQGHVTSAGPGRVATRLSLDVRDVPAGVYFLKLRQEEQELTRKLVVQR